VLRTASARAGTVAVVPRHPAGAASAVGVRVIARRLVSVLAPLSVLAGLFRLWRVLQSQWSPGSVVVAVGFALALLAVVGALSVHRKHLGRLDIAVLVLALVLFLLEHRGVFNAGHTGETDEARLGSGALRLLLAGHDPYVARIPERTGTHLLTGGVVTHYAYPPLTLEIGWLLSHLSRGLGRPWVLAVFGVVCTAVIVFLALPRGWRALAVPATLGFRFLDGYAANGFPVLIALPLLCLAGYRWTDIGAGGRLSRRAVWQAVALGLAISAQQLAWFVAALLLVAVWVVRCGETSRARAGWIVGRFAVIAVATFALVNLPFTIWDAGSWAHGILAVFVQQAKPFGAGLIVVAVDLVGHSGDLRDFAYATAALTAAMLAFTAAGLRRIAAAVPVLASISFLLSTRSDVEYFVALVPLWVAWAATTDPAAVDASRPVQLPARIGPVLTSAWRRSGAVALALVPAAVLTVLALASAPPITVSVPVAVRTGTRPAKLAVRVSNRSDEILRPTFSIGPRGRGHPWRPVRGPVVLTPGQRRAVLLAPDRRQGPVTRSWRVTVFVPDPPAFASAPLRLAPTPAVSRRSRPPVRG
jgi:hypothetical protein